MRFKNRKKSSLETDNNEVTFKGLFKALGKGLRVKSILNKLQMIEQRVKPSITSDMFESAKIS